MSGPSTEQAKGEPAQPLGLYLHVPFCASTCDFCAFYQTQPTAELVRRFLAGMEQEAGLVQWTRPIGTVFWGGGTPGLLAPRDLGRLAELVHSRAQGQPVEWTVELAPASVTGERLGVMRDAGVTRVSLGAQSFQPNLLDALGRNHTREQIYRAYDRVRAAGFESVNLDLMFALPGQTASEWAADVAAAVALAPDHLSTYCLTFEEDTKLWLKLSQGRVKLDPDLEADLYAATWEQLGAAGYPQYEISNFARPGHECRHNLNTWRMHEWIGLGPSAASQHEGVRGANVADLEEWLAQLTRSARVSVDTVPVTAELLAEDALIFGLRMNEGVDLAPRLDSAPRAPWSVIDQALGELERGELLVRDGSRVRLTHRGRLLADSVGAEIMTAFAALAETT